jgi:hypothetical protein
MVDRFEPGYGTNPEAPRPYRQALCALGGNGRITVNYTLKIVKRWVGVFYF